MSRGRRGVDWRRVEQQRLAKEMMGIWASVAGGILFITFSMGTSSMGWPLQAGPAPRVLWTASGEWICGEWNCRVGPGISGDAQLEDGDSGCGGFTNRGFLGEAGVGAFMRRCVGG